jgi:hypothetical protein
VKGITISISWGERARSGRRGWGWSCCRPYGRRTSVQAFGDSAPELEADALARARDRFGPEAELEVQPDYHIYPVNVYLSMETQELDTRPEGAEPRRLYATIYVVQVN